MTQFSEKEKEAVILGIFVALVVLGGIALGGSLFMIVAGIINKYWAVFPAFSFLESTVILLVLVALGRIIRGGK